MVQDIREHTEVRSKKDNLWIYVTLNWMMSPLQEQNCIAAVNKVVKNIAWYEYLWSISSSFQQP
jgi:hypothetical protein